MRDEISLLIAFSAGILSFLSPCVLPMVPAYASYLTGSAVSELGLREVRLKLIYKSIGFVIGFSIVFIIMGLSLTSIGKLFAAHQDIIRKIGGVLIFVFGIHTLGIFKIKALYREKRMLPFGEGKVGNASSIFLGMAFATGWTPCIGPILSSILMYAQNMDTIGKGTLLLGMYSLGMAVPFILTAFAIGSFSEYFKKVSRYFPVISIVSGLLMMVMGVLVYKNQLIELNKYFNFINI